ncbi:MAG TPA: lipopolysaccharide kinase InaA family protein [Gemmatimonadaceae bacterium]|nr:lipopolysaccharide kinase InaA family protein [Gemmatimonadaceae bacterium]
MRLSLPGYARIESARASGIALETCRGEIESILTAETVYDFAARQPDARKFNGRAPVYAIPLGACGNMVVRRSMRGGAFASLHTDLFLPPTRGLRELIAAMRLRAVGIPTPEVAAFVTYPAGAILRRSDVITREVGGDDLGALLTPSMSADRRANALTAAATLVASLSKAGAHHPDLNLRNILVDRADSNHAWVLDVDRIRFHVPGDPIVARANADRLERSLRKRRDLGEIAITDDEINALRASPLESGK